MLVHERSHMPCSTPQLENPVCMAMSDWARGDSRIRRAIVAMLGSSGVDEDKCMRVVYETSPRIGILSLC
jgi:hypothetical protein